MSMKISQEMLRETSRHPVRTSSEGKQNFDKYISTETGRMHNEELDKLMTDIKKQGEKLASFRSFQDLAKFKRMIKQFLNEAINSGLELDETRSFNSNSFSHKMTTVKELDEKLIDLTEDLMDQEKKTVDLLGLIGEIEGLLINIYT